MSNFVQKLKKAPGFVCMKRAISEQVSQAEESLAVTFANEYKEYVLECGAASFRGHELTGVCMSRRLNVVDVTSAARKLNPVVPDNLYVIEEANIDGILVWQNSSGSVYISKPGIPATKVADSLQEYFKL